MANELYSGILFDITSLSVSSGQIAVHSNESNRFYTVTVSMVVKTADTNSYSARIRVVGQGYAEFATISLSSVGSSATKTGTFKVRATESEADIPFHVVRDTNIIDIDGEVSSVQSQTDTGLISNYTRDSYLKVVVEAVDAVLPMPTILTTSHIRSAGNSNFTKTIKVTGTVE